MSTPLPLLRTRLRARYRLPAMTSSTSSSTVLGWSRRRPRSASLLSSHSFSTTTTLPQHHSWSEQPSIATGKQSYNQRQYQYQYQRVDYNNYYGTRSCISRHSGGATVTTRNTVVSPSRHIDCSRRWASSMIGSSLSSSLSDETILPLEGDAMSAVATTAAADVGDGYDSGYDSGSDGSSSSSAMIETTTTTTTTTTPKKEKKSKRKRRKEGMARERALDVRFLHFQDYATGNGGGGGNASDNDDDSDDPQERAACLLRDDFDRLACDHDLSNFKWISLLEKQLVLRIRKEREDDLKKAAAAAAADADPSTTQNNNNNNNKHKHNNRLREYWKMALKASSNPKKVPEELKAHFLSRMVVQSGDGVDNNGDNNDNTNNSNIIDDNTNDTESPVLTDSDRADAVWLARGREVAVRHPLLWRRYSAKERKRKVRIAKNILRDRAADYEREREHEHEHENSSNNSGDDEADDEASAAQAFAASQDPSTSLEFYLDWIRIPALIRTHHTETTEDQKWEDAIAMQQLLKERLPVTSYRKMINLVTSYVECFTTDDDDHNPASGGGYGDGDDDSNNDDDDERLVTLPTSPLSAGSANVPLSETNDDDDDDDEPEASSKSKKQKQKQFRVLLTNLRKTLPRGRIHWVAKDVANFFYVTTPDEVDLTVAGRKVHMDADVTPNHQTFDSFEMDLLTQDPVLGYSLTNWNEVREQYVQSFLNLQTLFLQLEKEEEEQQQKAGTTEMQSTGLSPKASIDQVLDQNDDPSSEESVIQTFDIVTALSRLDQKKTTTERVRPREYIPLEAMAMGEYWKNHSPSASTAPTNDDVVMADLLESKAKTDATSKDRTRDDDKPGSSSAFRVFDNDSFPLVPPVERLVIVDNLPIDINEQRIREAYGRCGAIEGIQIFHSRPDLDPGRRSTDSTKKIRSPSSSSRRQKWSRPRTPLYAMVLYKDAKSAKAAACDPLRIFGMVLDHHLMRSHRASDMTTLYLEDVPYSRHDVSSMEFELSQLLRPADLYLCLDDSGHKHLRKKGGGIKSQPLSYTIKFPSFEAAYWSYWKLSLELQILRESERTPSHARATAPALHWMETPKDAKLYWTRKLNF